MSLYQISSSSVNDPGPVLTALYHLAQESTVLPRGHVIHVLDVVALYVHPVHGTAPVP